MKLLNIIHKFQDYLKSERIRAEQAKADGAYLVNAYTDKEFLKELIKNTDKQIDVFMLDGVHLVIHANEKKKSNRHNIWNY